MWAGRVGCGSMFGVCMYDIGARQGFFRSEGDGVCQQLCFVEVVQSRVSTAGGILVVEQGPFLISVGFTARAIAVLG